MSKIDENEAPEGFRAVEIQGGRFLDCDGCCFYDKCDIGGGPFLACVADNRKDGQDVIFKKKEVVG